MHVTSRRASRHIPGHGVRIIGLQVIRASRIVELECVGFVDIISLDGGLCVVALQLQTAEHCLILEVLERVQHTVVVYGKPALLPQLRAVDVELQVASERARVARLDAQHVLRLGLEVAVENEQVAFVAHLAALVRVVLERHLLTAALRTRHLGKRTNAMTSTGEKLSFFVWNMKQFGLENLLFKI